MDKILCLACNKVLEIPQFIDTDNYYGQLVCSKCKALLYVKFVKGKLLNYKIVEKHKPERTTSMVFIMPDGSRLTPGELARTKKIEDKSLIKKDTRSAKLKK